LTFTNRKVSLVLKTDWPCKPVPCRTKRWLKSPCSCITCTSKISLPRYNDRLYNNDHTATQTSTHTGPKNKRPITTVSQKGIKQAGWFLRPDCDPRSECPQFGMPAERRAQFRVSNVPDPEFPNVLHSEFMNMPNVEFLNVPLCSVPMSYLASSKRGRRRACRRMLVLAAKHRQAHSIGRGCHVHTCDMMIGADFKMYLLSQFCSNRVEFFLQYTGDTDAKK